MQPDPRSSQGTPARSLMFIAGEASGDAHAADVIRAIKTKSPETRCFGAGGPKMRAAGMELALDLTEHAVLGLVEVLRNYFKFRQFFHQMLDLVSEQKPDAVILVDYPGFNLRFAKALHRRYRRSAYRPKVIYYISPQVWAWAERRVKLIERCVALLLSIFPFEKEWFAARAPKLRVEFVGHPMLDRFAGLPSRIDQPRGEPVVALLPGSRAREVRLHWPILRKAARRLVEQDRTRVVVLAASDRIQALLERDGAGEFEICRSTVDALSRSTIAIAASGTVTLECAYFGVPTVVIYKVAWPTYCVGRLLVTVKHLAMPNVLAGRTIYPELIQHRATANSVYQEAHKLLADDRRRAVMKGELARVIASLGSGGASGRAAELIRTAVER